MSTTSSGVRVRRRPWRLPSLSLAAVVLLAHVAGLWGKPCGEANPPTSTLWWLTLRVTSGTSVRMSIPVVVVVVHLHLPSHRQAQDRNVSRASHASPSQIRCAREMKSDRGCTARYNTPHTRTHTHTHTHTHKHGKRALHQHAKRWQNNRLSKAGWLVGQTHALLWWPYFFTW
jgi:hypothetical protein